MKRTLGSLARQEERAFYLCVSPWIIGFVLFAAGPICYLLYISLTNMHNAAQPYTVVGADNYTALFQDPTFWQSLWNTVYYVVLLLPVSLVISLVLAVLLNQRIPFQAAFRTVYYLPVITPLVAASVLWLWVLNPQYGLLNNVLAVAHVPRPAWLADPLWAKPALILMALWGGVGSQMVINLAALQGVPGDLLEAAEVDGANAWQRFWRITVPLISPALFFNLVIGVVGSFQVFTPAFIMTSGGPLQATLFYVLYIFQQAFEYYHLGYAAALSWLLLLLVLFLTLVQFRYLTRFVHYEGGV